MSDNEDDNKGGPIVSKNEKKYNKVQFLQEPETREEYFIFKKSLKSS